jgi:DNA-directed RNA polymerase specialized sigma24 family protein
LPSTSETHRAIDAVWRIESARLIAGLTRIVRDVGLAEELAQDALVVALEQWPESGVPDNPGAWLMATAKHRAIDFFRRNEMLERKHAELARDLEEREAAAPDLDAALTLRLLGGLTTDEIARAFLVPEATVAQRIVRAKRTLADAGVPFEIPRRSELAERLSSVLEVIYLIFNEGYAATAGEDWMRLGGVEPRRRGVDGIRAGRGTRARGPADAVAEVVSPAAERARRPCSRSWDVWTKRVRSWSAPRRSRGMNARARCCWSERRSFNLRLSRTPAILSSSSVRPSSRSANV